MVSSCLSEVAGRNNELVLLKLLPYVEVLDVGQYSAGNSSKCLAVGIKV